MRSPADIISMRRVVIDRFHPVNRTPTETITAEAAVAPAQRFKNAQKALISLNHVYIKAAAMALREDIFFNADYDGRGRFYPNDRIDIRTPVDFGEYPLHIVIPEADKKSVAAIAQTFYERLERAKTRIPELMNRYVDFQKNRPVYAAAVNAFTRVTRRVRPLIPPWEKRWYAIQHQLIGTFMVSNMAALRVVDCRGKLVKPSIALLIIFAARDRIEKDAHGAPVARKYQGLGLSYDTRVVDPERAARFLSVIKRNIEEPERYCV